VNEEHGKLLHISTKTHVYNNYKHWKKYLWLKIRHKTQVLVGSTLLWQRNKRFWLGTIKKISNGDKGTDNITGKMNPRRWIKRHILFTHGTAYVKLSHNESNFILRWHIRSKLKKILAELPPKMYVHPKQRGPYSEMKWSVKLKHGHSHIIKVLLFTLKRNLLKVSKYTHSNAFRSIWTKQKSKQPQKISWCRSTIQTLIWFAPIPSAQLLLAEKLKHQIKLIGNVKEFFKMHLNIRSNWLRIVHDQVCLWTWQVPFKFYKNRVLLDQLLKVSPTAWHWKVCTESLNSNIVLSTYWQTSWHHHSANKICLHVPFRIIFNPPPPVNDRFIHGTFPLFNFSSILPACPLGASCLHMSATPHPWQWFDKGTWNLRLL
jgi:hypothetical protein